MPPIPTVPITDPDDRSGCAGCDGCDGCSRPPSGSLPEPGRALPCLLPGVPIDPLLLSAVAPRAAAAWPSRGR